MEVLVSSVPRGLAPREGLEFFMLEVGRARPSMEPRHGPRAGKSGYPHSQNTDSSPRDQGTLGLFFEELVTVGEAPTDFVLLTTE